MSPSCYRAYTGFSLVRHVQSKSVLAFKRPASAVTDRGFGSTNQESNMSNASKNLRGFTGKVDDRAVLAQALRAIQGDGLLIYAVRTNDDLIKIGITSDLDQRRFRITGGTAQILALKPGTFADELAIHQSLKGHATQGREYYLPTPAVLKVVNTMRAPLGLEPVTFERRWAP